MKVTPTLEEVLAYRGKDTHLAVSVELLADTETPISLYRKLASDRGFSFLLESAEGGETVGRYSFIGFDPALTFEFSAGKGVVRRAAMREEVEFGDPLEMIERFLEGYRVAPRPDLPRFQGGAVGYLGYDCVPYFEPVVPPADTNSDRPEGFFILAEHIVIVDHLRHRVTFVDHLPLADDRGAAYQAIVSRFEEWIRRLRSPPPT